MLTPMPSEYRDSTHYLRERYGLSGRKRRAWLVPAAALLVVGGGWLIWSADHFSKPEIRSNVISFQATDSQSISIKYFASVRTAAKAHQCILIASDYQANTVGQVTDVLPAGHKRYTHTVKIPTRVAAVSASIDHCS